MAREAHRTGALPSETEAREVLDRALGAVHADGAEASLEACASRLTAFAAGGIRHTIAEEGRVLSLAAIFDRRVVRVSTTRTDDEAVAALARRAETMARVTQKADFEIGLAGPVGPLPPERFDQATAAADPALQIEDAQGVLLLARTRGLEAAGVFLCAAHSEAIANTAGLRVFARATEAEAAITMRRVLGNGGTSGYGAAAAWRANEIHPEEIAAAAANKALWGGPPARVPRGEYTVVLEPLAVAELLLFLSEGFNARSVLEDDSFLTGKVGQTLMSPRFTLTDDVTHPLQRGIPFDGEGVPKRRVRLVDQGRIAGLLFDRATAARMKAEPTGHGYAIPNPDGAEAHHLVLEPGAHPRERLVSECERGILVTRFWYARPVDPGTCTVTGLTRDGTFLIEDGRVTRRLEDLRWNESLLEAFARLDAVGDRPAVVPMEDLTVVTPPVRIPGFHFTA
jgi:PmbA protein